MTVPAELRALFADLHLSMEDAVVDGVWRARRVEDGVAVAVKMWPIPAGVDPVARMRLQDEAVRALGDATPHVYERRLLPGHVVSVMRWEDGRAPETPMSPTEPVFRGLLEAVARLHRRQLVHRDLCPRNVLVRPDGRVLVLDLEEVVRAGQAADVVGTTGYLAPEVEAGRPVSSAADVFALGRFLQPSGATVVAALAQSDVLAWRAESADELRAALPIPADAAPFRGEIRGPAALHDVVGRARRLRDAAAGRVWLDRLCAAGFGRPEPDGGRWLHPAELNRWQALSEAPLSPTAAWSAIEAGAPARAVWGLLAGAADGQPVTVEWMDVLGLATIEALDQALLRYVRVMLGRVVTTDPDGAAWWIALLGAALRAGGTGTAVVLSELQATGVPDRMVARRAWSVVLFRVALSVGLEPARSVLTMMAQSTEPRDPDRAVRIQAWRGLLAYRSGDYLLAGDLLEGAWSRRQFDHLAAVTASNLVAVWLHVDRPDRAESVGRAALQRLTPGAHPRAAARLAAKLREAVYRAHAAPSPDLPMLEAISVASAPVGVALATLTEAAAAWRAGDLVTAARLADETAVRFEATGILGGYLLAAALACRTGHPDWVRAVDRVEARVDRILDEEHGPYLPAVAAQVLGMLATSPESALAEDALELALESGLAMVPRREVLSLAEATKAATGLPGR